MRVCVWIQPLTQAAASFLLKCCLFLLFVCLFVAVVCFLILLRCGDIISVERRHTQPDTECVNKNKTCNKTEINKALKEEQHTHKQ